MIFDYVWASFGERTTLGSHGATNWTLSGDPVLAIRICEYFRSSTDLCRIFLWRILWRSFRAKFFGRISEKAFWDMHAVGGAQHDIRKISLVVAFRTAFLGNSFPLITERP